LDFGVIDYLVKLFVFVELVVWVCVYLCIVVGCEVCVDVFEIGWIWFDLLMCYVMMDGEEVCFFMWEFVLFGYLLWYLG